MLVDFCDYLKHTLKVTINPTLSLTGSRIALLPTMHIDKKELKFYNICRTEILIYFGALLAYKREYLTWRIR
jgi:hypothetical protein